MCSCVCVAFPTDATMGMDAVAFPRNPFFWSSYLDISERLGRYSIFFFAEYDIFDFPFGKINVVWMFSTNNIHFIINSTNSPAALDTDFDGIGECNDATLLPSRSEGTADGCTVADGYDDFTPFISPVIALSSNSTLDIKIQFYTFTQADVGLYIDNIIYHGPKHQAELKWFYSQCNTFFVNTATSKLPTHS